MSLGPGVVALEHDEAVQSQTVAGAIIQPPSAVGGGHWVDAVKTPDPAVQSHIALLAIPVDALRTDHCPLLGGASS